MPAEVRIWTRAELVAQFWAEVLAVLIWKKDQDRERVEDTISQYRLETERLELGDVVYNQGVERVSEVILGIIDHGWPEVEADRPNDF